jgi:hypothetical protein
MKKQGSPGSSTLPGCATSTRSSACAELEAEQLGFPETRFFHRGKFTLPRGGFSRVFFRSVLFGVFLPGFQAIKGLWGQGLKNAPGRLECGFGSEGGGRHFCKKKIGDRRRIVNYFTFS